MSALEKIAETTNLKPLSIFEKILYYLGLLIELISIATRNTLSFKGIKIGWMENEFGIKVGSILTAYGDIIYNSKEKSLRIDNPVYFLLEKSNIIKKMREKIFGSQVKMVLLAIPFILTSAFLIKKAITFYKNFMKKRREEQ